MKRFITWVLLFLGVSFMQVTAFAQTAEHGLSFITPELSPAVGFGTNFNDKDLFCGVDAGIADKENLWSLTLGFDFRPFTRPVLVKKQRNVFYQYREKRMLMELMADKFILPIRAGENSYGVYGELGLAYIFGSYHGTSISPPDNWILTPGGGLGFNHQNMLLMKLGYRWVDPQSLIISKHRVVVSLLFII